MENLIEEDRTLFDAFQKGITDSSTDIPGYFYDVLEKDFENLLA